jgi:hypothetical protein
MVPDRKALAHSRVGVYKKEDRSFQEQTGGVR